MEDVLHVQCFVEKMINPIVLIWTISFNVKKVKQKPLKVCITWKIVGFSLFHTKNINMVLKALFTINGQHFHLVVQGFIFSKNVFHWELLEFVLPYT